LFLEYSRGKTSLLYQYAIQHAEKGKSVLFISKDKNKLRSSPPLLPIGSDPSTKALKNIHFNFVTNDEQLRKLFCSIHLMNFLPSLIIIDDFSNLFLKQLR